MPHQNACHASHIPPTPPPAHHWWWQSLRKSPHCGKTAPLHRTFPQSPRLRIVRGYHHMVKNLLDNAASMEYARIGFPQKSLIFFFGIRLLPPLAVIIANLLIFLTSSFSCPMRALQARSFHTNCRSPVIEIEPQIALFLHGDEFAFLRPGIFPDNICSCQTPENVDLSPPVVLLQRQLRLLHSRQIGE